MDTMSSLSPKNYSQNVLLIMLSWKLTKNWMQILGGKSFGDYQVKHRPQKNNAKDLCKNSTENRSEI